MKLRDLITLKTNDPDAEFWIVRRGSIEKVGMPSKEYSKESYGVRIKPGAEKIILAGYLYYAMLNLHSQGVWQRLSIGTTGLRNITKKDILDIPLG
jgi:hypothetical protein